jgi:DNA-binding transcriptional LysR family regulator
VQGLLRGQLTIGLIQDLGPLSVPALLARYHRRHPAVTLRLRHGSATSLVQGTADGELDLAIVDLPLGPQANRVHAQALGTETLLLGVPADDPLAGRRRIRLAQLAERDFVEYRADSSIRARIDQVCRGAGLNRHVAAEVETIGHLVELISHGVGVSLLPPAVIQTASGRLVGLVTEPTVPRELLLVTPLDRQPPPAAQALLALMQAEG